MRSSFIWRSSPDEGLSASIDSYEILMPFIKGMILNNFAKRMVNGLSLVLSVLPLSGCATK